MNLKIHNTLEGYALEQTSQGHNLSVYIWFWYATTKDKWSFQLILIGRQNCLSGVLVALIAFFQKCHAMTFFAWFLESEKYISGTNFILTFKAMHIKSHILVKHDTNGCLDFRSAQGFVSSTQEMGSSTQLSYLSMPLANV